MKRLALLLTLLVLTVLAEAGSALALTRPQAAAIAMRVLRPQHEPGRVVLFAMPGPLAASQSVAIASLGHEGDVPATRGLKPVGRRVWLFWEDLAYDARFEHPSKLLLVDDLTGTTLVRSISWFPLIDGRKPPFLRTPAAYASSEYIVYSSLKAAPTKKGVNEVAAPTRAGLGVLPSGAFKGDCMIMIGRYDDPFFTPDFKAMDKFALLAGLRSWWAAPGTRPSAIRPPAEAGPGSFEENVSWLIANEGCKDVFMYIDGHGAAQPRSAAVDIGDGNPLNPATLVSIMEHHRDVSFKIKLDTCFAGRFLEPLYHLKAQPNLLVFEASSRSNETSYSMLDDPRKSDGEAVVRKVDHPGVAEFTNRDLTGLEHFASSKEEITTAVNDGGDFLAHALADSFYDGASSDAAWRAGLTHPILYTNFTTPSSTLPSANPQTPCNNQNNYDLKFPDYTQLHEYCSKPVTALTIHASVPLTAAGWFGPVLNQPACTKVDTNTATCVNITQLPKLTAFIVYASHPGGWPSGDTASATFTFGDGTKQTEFFFSR